MRLIRIVVFACLAVSAFAQQKTPRAEVFGGYSFLHIDTQGITGASLDTACNDLLGVGTCPAGSFQVHRNFNGWNGALQVNVNHFFGLKADFSGHYGTPVSLSSQIQTSLAQAGIAGLPPKASSYSYLFGPVVFQNIGRYEPFAHALFGANSISTDLSGVTVGGLGIPGLTLTDTAFAMAFGGGLDIKFREHIWLRAGQLDYLFTKHDFSGGVPGIAAHQNNIRASAGVVFHLGGGRIADLPHESRPERVSNATLLIPSIGARVAPIDNNQGARVAEIIHAGPAELAGLHVDDVINFVSGTAIRTPTDLANALASSPRGTVRIGYLIRGQWQTEVVLILGSR